MKPHLINRCCFGEDLALWLGAELADLSKRGFEISQPMKRLFHRPDPESGRAVAQRVQEALDRAPDISVLAELGA